MKDPVVEIAEGIEGREGEMADFGARKGRRMD
jgi:hypothetical protein